MLLLSPGNFSSNFISFLFFLLDKKKMMKSLEPFLLHAGVVKEYYLMQYNIVSYIVL